MAGMEQLEIHSKSYLVRWVDVKSEHTISWSIQPHKKSIDFGIFRHPGSGIAPTPKLPSASFEVSQTPNAKGNDGSANSQIESAAVEKLTGVGLKLVSWQGNCAADLVSTGKYDVPKREGGMYALVFDNTFAKQFSKTVTFVLLTYPTHSAPQSHIQPNATGSSLSLRGKAKSRPKLNVDRHSSESLLSPALPSANLANSKSTHETMFTAPSSAYSLSSNNIFTGTLQKRRRKRGQGYARRFFMLDFTTSTLSYYHDRNSLTIRGSVPLTLAAVATNPSTREISVDSGAEVWHLKTLNKNDFETWRSALEFAALPQAHASSVASPRPDAGTSVAQSLMRYDPAEERDWAKVEALVSKISTSRDLARTLAKDTDPKYLPSTSFQSAVSSTADLGQYPSSTDLSPADFGPPGEDYFPKEHKPFWKRKASGTKTFGKRSASTQGTSPGLPAANGHVSQERSGSLPRSRLLPDESIHERCMKLLQDLDSVVTEFAALIAENKQRRNVIPTMAASRISLDSMGSQEFFDAEVGDGSSSQLLMINRESDDEGSTEVEENAASHDDSGSDLEDTTELASSVLSRSKDIAFPAKPKNLNLQAFAPIQRRNRIPPPAMSPPSLIGFLRKNVGKDLSTISMPVAANEPISLLQKTAEQMEYSNLLDEATSSDNESERLLYVSAFAISMLSEFRQKERAIRKPFNPMLGETYELVREDKGFRFVAEKVSHRPVRLACQADAEKWSLSHSPLPTQKFWGKSAELITEGKVRLTLHDHGEHYSWTQATCFLRNLIAGEKYIEPVGTMTVTNETSGEYAVATFKAKGMFSGRSEEVTVQLFNALGEPTTFGLVGKWTESLAVVKDGAPNPNTIWTVGSLVPDAAKCYGFPVFAASLNEVAERDRGCLPATDSRLRPDQRAVENGDYERAEELKARLEEAQRERRRIVEETGAEWEPAWFGCVEGGDGEEVWRLKAGKEGYWDARARKAWGERDVFAV